MSTARSIELYNYLVDAPGLPERELLPPETTDETVFESLAQVMDTIDAMIKRRRRRSNKRRARLEEHPPSYELAAVQPQPRVIRRNTPPPVYMDVRPAPDKHRFEVDSELRQAQNVLAGTTLSPLEYNYLEPRLKRFYYRVVRELGLPEYEQSVVRLHHRDVAMYKVKPLTDGDREFIRQYVNIRQ